MIRDFYAADGPDFLEINELRSEANYHDEVASVRASYFGKLCDAEAIVGDDGLAVFNIVLPSPDGLPLTENPRDILVQLKRSKESRPDAPLDVRIITNECFVVDGICRVLTEDVTIDHEENAQLFISAYELKATGDTLEPILDIEQSVQADGAIAQGKCKAPFFAVISSAKLEIVNVFSLTPRYTINADVKGQHRQVTPFGDAKDGEDNIYALHTAKLLFAEIKDLEPVVRLRPR